MNATTDASGIYRLICAALLACAALFHPAWGYENDGPGYDSTAPKKARLLASQSDTSFAPPEASDICFVATKGGDIGVEVWGNGSYSYREPRGSITIPLPINRYFGDKQKLIESEALPKTAKLTMVVWDVDNESSHTPAEYDEIFFNDNPPIDKKTLYGVNNGLKRNEFIINIDAINLPENPGETANNTIRIDVATKGGDWVTRIDWVALEIPAAPPVVIAHGIRDSAVGMSQLKTAIEDLGLPVHTFSFNNNGNDGIKAGARQLGDEIVAAKEKFHVDHVNIVAHSMGGLKAREYSENSKDVAKVLQIATPNAGAPFADLVVMSRLSLNLSDKDDMKVLYDFLETVAQGYMSISLTDDALRDLSVAHMNLYNRTAKLNDDVYYRVVAGSVVGGFGLDNMDYLFASATYNHGEEEGELKGDGIVPLKSAHTFISPYESSPIEEDANHASHTALVVGNARSTVDVLREDLTSKKTSEYINSPESMIKSRQNRTIAEYKSIMHGLLDFGSIDKDTISELPFDVVTQNDLLLLLEIGDCSACDVSFMTPYGTEIIPNETSTQMRRSASGIGTSSISIVENNNGHVIIKMRSPEIGPWTMRIVATQQNQSSSKMPYFFRINDGDTGIKVDAWLENENVKVGNDFNICVKPTINGTNVIGDIVAVMASRSANAPENPVSVNLSYSGNGLYVGSLPTATIGECDIAVIVKATSPIHFTQSTLLSGVVYDSASKFNGTTTCMTGDADGNGLYDNLVFNFAVDVTKSGAYRVLATLADTAGNEITEGWTSNIVCSVGTHTFPVAFDGRAIYGNGECGGYVVSSVKLLEIGDDYEAVIDERSDFFTTTTYTYRQFEHSLVAMLSGGNDAPTDTDGDGIYDKLDVTIPLYADDLVAGTYEWSASLENAEGSLLGTASGSVTFSLGTGGAPINMSFAGAGFSATDLDGPFYVKSLILWGNGRTFTISSEYATQPYSIKQWGGTPRHKPRYDFVEKTFSADEGEKLVVTIAGGDEEGPCSMQVYLTYNTATAADLDLSKGRVDGVAPKGGLKFPLTVSWAAGETGAKTIEIPVKSDTAFESDEFFTLQLANPSGMALGDFRVCTATIHDRNTKATLADAINNHSLKPSTAGAGKWVAVESWATAPDETHCVAFAESPSTLLAGNTATLSLGSVKGAGTLSFDMKFVGEDVGGASFVDVYDGKTLLKTFTMSGNGAEWKTCQVVSSTSGSRTLSIVMTQGADLASRVRIANVVWEPSSSFTPAKLEIVAYPAGSGFASGSGTYSSGSKVSLSATPRPGHAFVGWYFADGSLFSSKAKTTGYLNGNAGLIALFSRSPYVRGLADPVSAGKVTGSGFCASGKKVTLKATASKGFVLEGWYDERDVRLTQAASLVVDNSAKPAKPSATTYVISNCVSDVTYYARFVTVEEDRASISCAVGDMEFPAGSSTSLDAELPCGVWVDWPVVSSGLSKTTAKVSGLPSGLKYNTKTGSIEGVPSAPSKKDANTGAMIPSVVKITVTTAGKSTKDFIVNLTIAEMPSAAVGTFNGFVSPYDSASQIFHRALSMASFTLTTTAAGKITAKAVSPKGTVSFSANYWDELEEGTYSKFLLAKTGEMLYLHVDGAPQYWNGSNHAYGLAIGGSFGTSLLYVEAQRSSFLKSGKDYEHPEAVDLASAMQGTYKFDAEYQGDGAYGLVPVAGGKAPLTLTIKNTGAATVAGTVPGTAYKFSGTGTMRVYPSSGEAEIFACGKSGKSVNVMVILNAVFDSEAGSVNFDGNVFVNMVK